MLLIYYTTTLIARLIFKTIQSRFLLKTLKTLRERLAIVRKIVDHYQKFLKLNQKSKSKSKIQVKIENRTRNRKSKSKSKIENRNRKSTTIEKIENRKSRIENRKSRIENRIKKFSQSVIRLVFPEGWLY